MWEVGRTEIRSGAHAAPLPSRSRASTSSRTSRTPRRSLRALGIGVLVVGFVGGAAAIGRWALDQSGAPAATAGCRVVVPGVEYPLSIDQAANAATIAAVGKRMGLPDHAVSVALATALQESRLHNLNVGDADSLGIFQQRPSQGWGSVAEVMDPSHAAQSFYEHLRRIPGWEALPVTVASQTVQRSAAPDAYAEWESEARALARVLTGEIPAGLRCVIPASLHARDSRSLSDAIARDLGSPALGTALDGPRGWTVASWLVGHAAEFGITSVAVQGQRWTPGAGTWERGAPFSATVELTHAR